MIKSVLILFNFFRLLVDFSSSLFSCNRMEDFFRQKFTWGTEHMGMNHWYSFAVPYLARMNSDQWFCVFACSITCFRSFFSSQNQHFALCFLSCFDLVWSLLIGTGKLYKEAWGELLRCINESMGYVSWGGWAHNPVEGIWCARLSVQEGVSPSPPVAKLCGCSSLCRLIHESSLVGLCCWICLIVDVAESFHSFQTDRVLGHPPKCGVLNFLSSRFHSQVGIFVCLQNLSLCLCLMLISEGIEFMPVCCSWGFFSTYFLNIYSSALIPVGLFFFFWSTIKQHVSND